jgi:hypothetical protein
MTGVPLTDRPLCLTINEMLSLLATSGLLLM